MASRISRASIAMLQLFFCLHRVFLLVFFCRAQGCDLELQLLRVHTMHLCVPGVDRIPCIALRTAQLLWKLRLRPQFLSALWPQLVSYMCRLLGGTLRPVRVSEFST